MIKRALAAALCLIMVFALLPKTARADEEVVWIEGVALTAATPYYHNVEDSESHKVNNVADGYNAYYDVTEYVLYLNGLSVTNSVATTKDGNGADLTYAICIKRELTLNLSGSSTVSTAQTAQANCAAVFSANGYTLTVTGSGTLTAIGNNGSGYACGLLADTLVMNNGAINGTAGTVSGRSYGVSAATITVNGGSITGTGGTANGASSESSGVCAGSSITINGGSIKGTAGTGNESIGVKCSTIKPDYSVIFRLEGKGARAFYAFSFILPDGPAPYWRIAEDGEYTQDGAWQTENFKNKPPYLDVRTALPTTPSIKVSVPAFGLRQAPENESVTVNSNDGINATDNFLSAKMDDKLINVGSVSNPGADGSVSDGSIIIRLNKTYLDTLPAGTHTLRVNLKGVYAGQYVETQIAVSAPGADVPKTGDSATPVLWLGLILLAGAGLAGSAVMRRRRQNG